MSDDYRSGQLRRVTVDKPAEGRPMFNWESKRTETYTWLTPKPIIDALGPFDLDPCAAPEPRLWPTAARHIVLPEDGLHAPWEGRVWLNPPFGRHAEHWMRKLADHGTGTGLVFARTDAKWFVEQVWNRATLLLFVAGRIRYHRADGSLPRVGPGAPSVLVAYGEYDADRLAKSGLAGAATRLERAS